MNIDDFDVREKNVGQGNRDAKNEITEFTKELTKILNMKEKTYLKKVLVVLFVIAVFLLLCLLLYFQANLQ